MIPSDLSEKKIRYLEIGTLCGANLLSVANSFCRHPESELHCVDPWMQYSDYPEPYDHADMFRLFLFNVASFSERAKIHIHRGFSHEQVPNFPDDFFDIIYIDGNHETKFVLEDAVISFRKLKHNGFMIFDDYNEEPVKLPVDNFVTCYQREIEVIGDHDCQLFIRKIDFSDRILSH
jgi:hypothetical protein